MQCGKKSKSGRLERLTILREVFLGIDVHVEQRPVGVGVDDLLDAAAAAWTAIRRWQGVAVRMHEAERDERGLLTTIHY
jgi:predicted RNase H-like nuclease